MEKIRSSDNGGSDKTLSTKNLIASRKAPDFLIGHLLAYQIINSRPAPLVRSDRGFNCQTLHARFVLLGQLETKTGV